MENNLIENLPPGPLDHYRKQASFDWKKMKLFFEDPELLKIKVVAGTQTVHIFCKISYN